MMLRSAPQWGLLLRRTSRHPFVRVRVGQERHLSIGRRPYTERKTSHEAFGAHPRKQRADPHQQRYQTLGGVLDRLPRGVRELLLWSPLLWTLYFVLKQQRPYYFGTEESFSKLLRTWWKNEAPLSTFLSLAPSAATPNSAPFMSTQEMREGCPVVVEKRLVSCLVDNSKEGATLKPFSPPIVPFSSVTWTSQDSTVACTKSKTVSGGAAVQEVLLSKQNKRDTVDLPSGSGRDAQKRDEVREADNVWGRALYVKRDPLTGCVVGYTVHA